MDLPSGTRNYDYATDMAVLRTKTHWAFFIGFLIIVFTAPLYLRDNWLGIFNLIGITIIAVTGLNILVGYCGQLSIGHAGFMAVGAYTTGILTGSLGWPFLVGLLCAGLSAGLIGIIFGLPSVRVKGFYLAITTIAAQLIIIWIINHWTSVTGGFMGMNVPRASIGPLVFKSEASQFYLIMVIVAVCLLVAKNLARGRVGRAFIAVRDNDLAAEVMGINLLYYKLLAFFIGCFLAGIAGALLAHWTGFLNGENFTLTDSILYIGMVIIGGLGTTIGPIIGVVVIRLLQQGIIFISPFIENAIPALSTGFTTGLGPMVFGLVIILFLILEPRGLAHRWTLFKAAYRLWPFSY
ncbi:MAG TPA: branched-chain amino acid ABC transporter permease [Dehalococcoidia bacterium]|jgi:branched-chain amino acid transport system permease protein